MGAVFSDSALAREGGLLVCQALLGQVQRLLMRVTRLRSLAQLGLRGQIMILYYCNSRTAQRQG